MPLTKTTILSAKNQVAAELVIGDGYVVAVPLLLDSVADAWRLQRAVEAELRTTGLRLVLMDARQAAISRPDANESMWTSTTPRPG